MTEAEEIAILEDRIEALTEQIKKMKCCENCKYYKYDCTNGYDCKLGVFDTWKTHHKKCSKWKI